MPTYLHKCDSCNSEWEAEYSIKADPPKTCPECNQESVRRLINCEGGKTVELVGDDLVQKVKQDASIMKREALKDENKMANLIGEAKYEKNLKEQAKLKDYKKEAKNFRRIHGI